MKLSTDQGKLMKMKLAATCLAFATLVGAAAIWVGEDSNPGLPLPVIFVRDSAITTAVKGKIAAAHIAGLGPIHVGTDKGGVVWLTGSARTQEAADAAAFIARETKDVTAVYNDLKVRKDG